ARGRRPASRGWSGPTVRDPGRGPLRPPNPRRSRGLAFSHPVLTPRQTMMVRRRQRAGGSTTSLHLTHRGFAMRFATRVAVTAGLVAGLGGLSVLAQPPGGRGMGFGFGTGPTQLVNSKTV